VKAGKREYINGKGVGPLKGRGYSEIVYL